MAPVCCEWDGEPLVVSPRPVGRGSRGAHRAGTGAARACPPFPLPSGVVAVALMAAVGVQGKCTLVEQQGVGSSRTHAPPPCHVPSGEQETRHRASCQTPEGERAAACPLVYRFVRRASVNMQRFRPGSEALLPSPLVAVCSNPRPTMTPRLMHPTRRVRGPRKPARVPTRTTELRPTSPINQQPANRPTLDGVTSRERVGESVATGATAASSQATGCWHPRVLWTLCFIRLCASPSLFFPGVGRPHRCGAPDPPAGRVDGVTRHGWTLRQRVNGPLTQRPQSLPFHCAFTLCDVIQPLKSGTHSCCCFPSCSFRCTPPPPGASLPGHPAAFWGGGREGDPPLKAPPSSLASACPPCACHLRSGGGGGCCTGDTATATDGQLRATVLGTSSHAARECVRRRPPVPQPERASRKKRYRDRHIWTI